MNIPPEIIDFINGNWGKSLLIKGSPGSGKTTLALEIMSYAMRKNGAIYFSTRQGDQSLYHQFPWLKFEDYKNVIIDTSYEFLETLGSRNEDVIDLPSDAEKINASRKFLGSIREGVEPILSLNNLMKLNVRRKEFYRLVYLLKSKFKPGLVLIIDSIEGIAQRWNVTKVELMDAIQKDLVESSGLNVIIVSEQNDSSGAIDVLEYLVDGVIRLEKKLIENRMTRLLMFDKLRFVESKNLIHNYTLAGGRFNYFDLTLYSNIQKYKLRSNGDKINLGFQELDALINDELKINSAIIESGNFPQQFFGYILAPLIVKSVNKNVGVIMFCDPNSDANDEFNILTNFGDPNILTDKVRIADFSSEFAGKKYIIPMGYEDPSIRGRELAKVIVDLMDKSDYILHIYRLSGIERIYGSIRVEDNLSKMISSIRPKKDKMLLINDVGRLDEIISRLGDIIFRSKYLGRIPIIYSDLPFTPFYGLQLNENGELFMQAIE